MLKSHLLIIKVLCRMELQDRKNNKLLSRLIVYFIDNVKYKRLTIISVGLFILMIYSIIMMYYGGFLYRSNTMGALNDKLHDLAVSKIDFIPNYLRGILSKPEKFFIDIKFMDLETLRYYRDKSITAKGVLSEYKETNVPATLKHNGYTYKIKISLTGATVMHVGDTQKWSFRIKVRDDESILRMKEFNLLYPRARAYLSDWVGHMLHKKQGLIGLRMNFVDVTLNGNHLGLYCLEENYDKVLIEDNNYRDGIIFKWSQIPKIYNKKRYLNDPFFVEQSEALNMLINAYNINDIGIEQIFDLSKMAKFFAINDLINGGAHGLNTSNTRFYFNPITNLISPIGREWEWTTYANEDFKNNKLSLSIDYLKEMNSYPYFTKFNYDTTFIKLYINELNALSDKTYLDEFFEEISKDMQQLTRKIYRFNPFYVYPKEFHYNNQNSIRSKIYPNQSIASYYNGYVDNNNVQLSIRNLQSFPVIIKSIILNDSLIILPQKRTVLFDDDNDTLRYQPVNFMIPKELDIKITEKDKLKINYSLIGMDSVSSVDVFSWSYDEIQTFSNNFNHQASIIFNNENFIIDSTEMTITFKKGFHTINNDLVIPSGYKIIANEGVGINLINSASIISYSPLHFSGSDDMPIKITSVDSTGNGLFVLNSTEKSILENIDFDNLSNPSKHGWKLTGAITFYESDVSINNCIFSNNRDGDDYLNVIRSDFNINNSIFKNINADAIDSDFSSGKVVNSSFFNCANDAIDISSSKVGINNISIERIGDKGISVGENSHVSANYVKIINAEIGISSKDLSVITVNNAYLEDNEIGLTAFRKKSEYGPGYIKCYDIRFKNVTIPYLVETFSELKIDGEIKQSKNLKIKDLLYGVKYGKSSN